MKKNMTRRVRVFDNFGKTVDRFTVVVSRTEQGARVWDVFVMSENPSHPTYGINQFSFSVHDDEYRTYAFDDDRRVKIEDLPKDVITAIEERLQ